MGVLEQNLFSHVCDFITSGDEKGPSRRNAVHQVLLKALGTVGQLRYEEKDYFLASNLLQNLDFVNKNGSPRSEAHKMSIEKLFTHVKE